MHCLEVFLKIPFLALVADNQRNRIKDIHKLVLVAILFSTGAKNKADTEDKTGAKDKIRLAEACKRKRSMRQYLFSAHDTKSPLPLCDGQTMSLHRGRWEEFFRPVP